MGITIKLDATAQTPTPPNGTETKLGNNLFKYIEIVGAFTETTIKDYINTNGLTVKVTEIYIFTNDESEKWATFLKGAGEYDNLNPVVEADIKIMNKNVMRNQTLTQAQYDALGTKDPNTLYFIPME